METAHEHGPLFSILEGCVDSDRMTWVLESTHGCRRNAGEHGQGTCTYMSKRQGWEFPFHQAMPIHGIASTSEHSVLTLQFCPELVGAAHASPGQFQDSLSTLTDGHCLQHPLHCCWGSGLPAELGWLWRVDGSNVHQTGHASAAPPHTRRSSPDYCT